MPILSEDNIYEIAFNLLIASGAPDGHSRTVAMHLADANLAGHDSHGFIRILQYIEQIENGIIDPKSAPVVVADGLGTAQINGNSTFGQVVANFATQLAIEKAQKYGISFINISNHAHTGRIGYYTELVAKEGMASIMFTGFVGGKTGNNVAPFGGRERRLGTNPISMSFPCATGEPILLDFATSMAAEGKLRVYRAKGDLLPDEWILTEEGVPSRNPNDYYDGGSILPLGGIHGGHEGYSLSLMVALFGAVMTGLKSPTNSLDDQISGSSIIGIDIGSVASIDDVMSLAESAVRYVKNTPAADNSSGVLYPGEMESNSRKQRQIEGVYIEQTTWDNVVCLIDKYGLKEILHLLFMQHPLRGHLKQLQSILKVQFPQNQMK